MNIIIKKEGLHMEYYTTTEMAAKWEVSARRIALLCEQNRIDGVIKKGKTWLIPENASKPSDARRKNEVNNDAER